MANVVFDNKIIEARATDLLTTAVNTRNLMAVDTSLTQGVGMTKTIIVYNYSGEAEELGIGEGNTNRGSVTHTTKDYTVKMVQHPFDYYDEEYLKDNNVVDNGIKFANNTMTNKFTADFIAELDKVTLTQTGGLSYDTIVDGIAKMNLEDEAGLFILTNPAGKATLRKDPDYVAARMCEVVYNGQVGTIAGIPVIVTKAVENTTILHKDAIKLFLKKDVEVEQERDADTRKNSIYLRAYYIVALEDATKACKITD
jgi:hypothetical protein